MCRRALIAFGISPATVAIAMSVMGIGARCTVKKKMASTRRRKWSQRVTQNSDALDLEPRVFAHTDPRQIARSLKRSAERSHRRKADPFRSAMSMLTFYINRAGRQLPPAQRKRLEQAKEELRALFGKPHRGRRSPGRRGAAAAAAAAGRI